MSIIESVVNRIGGGLGLFFDVPEVARYVTIDETLRGVTLPNPDNPASDRHFTHIDAPGLIPDSLPVLFFNTKHIR
jgi:hypothetical protein